MVVEGPSPPETTSLDPSDLREASLSGIRWVSLARLLAEVLTIGSSVVLARLITPAEFGRAAVALGFVVIALALASAGFGASLVQMRAIDQEDVEVATFLSLVIGTGLGLLVLFLLAPYVIEPIFGGRVAYLLQLSSPTFLAVGFGTVPNAILQRRLAFRTLSQIEMLAMLAGVVTAIVLAAGPDLEGEALILGGVATAWVGALCTFLSVPRTRPRWRRHRARGIAGFGAVAAFAAVIGTTFNNIDYAILGARLSPQDVGYYWRAYQVGVEYQSKISGIVLRLAFPIFSRTGSIDEMRRLRRRMIRMQTIVLYPALTTLIALAPEIVPLVFGDAWQPAVFPTQILAVAGMATAAVAGSAQMTLAAGKARAVLTFFLLLLAGYVVVVASASAHGLRVVVIAVAIYQVVLISAQFYVLDSRQIGISVRETWAGIRPALASSLVSLVATYAVAQLLEDLEAGVLMIILAGGTVAVAVYSIVLRIAFSATWCEAVELARALLRRGERSNAAHDELGSRQGQ